MEILNRYHNYELHPETDVKGCDDSAWDGTAAVVSELRCRIREMQEERRKSGCGNRIVVSFDCYPGVDKEEILSLAAQLDPTRVFDMEDYAKSEETLNREFADYITDDRVFGVICHRKTEDLFQKEKLQQAAEELADIT